MSEHPGLEFAPPIAALPFFAFDDHSSVIYNLYDSYYKCEPGLIESLRRHRVDDDVKISTQERIQPNNLCSQTNI